MRVSHQLERSKNTLSSKIGSRPFKQCHRWLFVTWAYSEPIQSEKPSFCLDTFPFPVQHWLGLGADKRSLTAPSAELCSSGNSFGAGTQAKKQHVASTPRPPCSPPGPSPPPCLGADLCPGVRGAKSLASPRGCTPSVCVWTSLQTGQVHGRRPGRRTVWKDVHLVRLSAGVRAGVVFFPSARPRFRSVLCGPVSCVII